MSLIVWNGLTQVILTLMALGFDLLQVTGTEPGKGCYEMFFFPYHLRNSTLTMVSNEL